jgi:hypothetical protein
MMGMMEARFVFQAVCPDPVAPDEADDASLIVFDAEWGGRLLSHQIAKVHSLADGFEVSHTLPFCCAGFTEAVETYFRLMIEQHGRLLSPSGPKGRLPQNNVFRAEWAISLPVSDKTPHEDT